jgi:hypothetical protein
MAIDDAVWNEDDGDRSIKGVGFYQAKGRFKLDQDKLYLDTCSSYNQMCTEKYLEGVSDNSKYYLVTESCNSGMTVSKKKGWYKRFHMWLNPDGIANLLSIGFLEVLGYTIEYKTGGDWIVTTPTGKKLSSSAKVEVYYRSFVPNQDG